MKITSRVLILLSLASTCLWLAACRSRSAEDTLVSVRTFLAANDSKAAVIEAKNALQLNPNLPEARYLLGKALLQSGDAQSASLELKKAADLKYRQQEVVPLLAKALVAGGSFKQLTDQFAEVTLGEPAADGDLKTSLALAYAAQGEDEKAKRAMNAALLAAPDYPPAILFKARVQAAERQFDQAFSSIDRVIAAAPKDPDAWYYKGELLLYAKQDIAGALSSFRQALAVKPDYVKARSRLIALSLAQKDLKTASSELEELRKTLPQHPQTIYSEAQLAFVKQDYEKARERSQLLLKLTPTNVIALQLAAQIESANRSPLRAEAYLSKALSISPNLPEARKSLAITFLRLGQPSRAADTLAPLLTLTPPDPDALALVAEAYLQSGKPKQAEPFFRRAAELNPKDVRSRAALAFGRMTSTNENTAFADLETLSSTDPGSYVDLALVSAYMDRKRWEDALHAIDRVQKKQPKLPLAAQLRGNLEFQRGNVAKARTEYERAVTLDAAYMPAVTALAALDMREQNLERAQKRFEAVLAVDPKNVQALLAIADLQARAGKPASEIATLLQNASKANPGEIQPRLRLIEHYLAMKNIKAALTAAQDAVAAAPDSAELLDALGRVQAVSGDTNQAISTFSKLATLQPKSPRAHVRLAGVHAAANDSAAAAEDLKRALVIEPTLLEAQQGLATLALADKRPKDALEIARTVQQQRSGDAVGYVMEGDVATALGNHVESARVYRSALKRFPSTRLAVKLHSALLAAGNSDEAAAFATGWPKEHPDDAGFFYHLGDLALTRGDYATAEAQNLTVLKLQPGNALAMTNIAWCMAKQKKRGAVAYADKASRLLPNSPAVMHVQALALASENEVAKAVKLQQAAVALAPTNSSYRLDLAKLYLQAGDRSAAKTELEALAKQGDAFSGKAEVGRLLGTL